MAEIPLYQRQQLPPSRVGAVKARRYQREADIPEMGVAEVVAGFVSPFLDKLTKVRAGNEQSEYLGLVAVAQEKATAQIADNPGMSRENKQKVLKQMMSDINEAGKNPNFLPQSKNFAHNYALKNRELIEAKFNTQAEEVETQFELSRFQLERQRLISERKAGELKKLYDGVSGTLLDPEVATLSFGNDLLQIDTLQEKFEAEEALEKAIAEARGFVDETGRIDMVKATEFLSADPSLTEAQKISAIRALNVWNAQNENNKLKIQAEKWEKNESALWESWRDDALDHSQIETLYENDDISKYDRDRYTALLDAEVEAGIKRLETETKILEAKDREEAERLIIKGKNAGTINESIISSAAEKYGISPARYEGYLKDLRDKKIEAPPVPYETRAELTSLITGVQFGKVEPDEVEVKITDMLQTALTAGLPKDEAVDLAVKYREKLATAITAWTKEDDPIGRPRAQLYLEMLDNYYDPKDEEPLITPLEYDKLNDRFNQFFKTEPTAEQAARFFEEAMRPYEDRVAKGFWRKLWDWTPLGKLAKRKPKEKPEESPYPEYPDAFQLGDSWYVWQNGKRYRIEE